MLSIVILVNSIGSVASRASVHPLGALLTEGCPEEIKGQSIVDCPLTAVIVASKALHLILDYSMPSSFLTSAVMSVRAAGSKYAKPADDGWSPAVLNTTT